MKFWKNFEGNYTKVLMNLMKCWGNFQENFQKLSGTFNKKQIIDVIMFVFRLPSCLIL